MTRATFVATRPLTRSQTRRRVIQKCQVRNKATTSNPKQLLTDLQTRLVRSSCPKYAKWLSRYLRNAPCHGLRTPVVQSVVDEWADAYDLRNEYAEELALARLIFESTWNEDKLAGVIYLRTLQKHGRFGVENVLMLEQLFDDDLINTWNIVDQLCSRVIANIAKQDVDIITSWVTAENVWRGRASIVALLPLLKREGIKHRLLESCKIFVKRNERFAKTAVGWALREVQKRDHDAVVGFIEEFANDLSVEATKNACKHMQPQLRDRLLVLVKTRGSGS